MGQRIIDECADLNCTITSSSAMMDMSMLTGSGISLELYGQDIEDLRLRRAGGYRSRPAHPH